MINTAKKATKDPNKKKLEITKSAIIRKTTKAKSIAAPKDEDFKSKNLSETKQSAGPRIQTAASWKREMIKKAKLKD